MRREIREEGIPYLIIEVSVTDVSRSDRHSYENCIGSRDTVAEDTTVVDTVGFKEELKLKQIL